LAFLTSQEALRALADGHVLEDEDGCDVLLKDNKLISRFEIGKHRKMMEQNFNNSLDKLVLGQEEEPDASE